MTTTAPPPLPLHEAPPAPEPLGTTGTSTSTPRTATATTANPPPPSPSLTAALALTLVTSRKHPSELAALVALLPKRSNSTRLLSACFNRDWDKVRALLGRGSGLARRFKGYSPLWELAQRGGPAELAHRMIAAGLDPNEAHEQTRRTCLFAAVAEPDASCAELARALLRCVRASAFEPPCDRVRTDPSRSAAAAPIPTAATRRDPPRSTRPSLAARRRG